MVSGKFLSQEALPLIDVLFLDRDPMGRMKGLALRDLRMMTMFHTFLSK